jgi:hypothetical protein
MYSIALFVKDFQKGAELSKRLTSMNMNVKFAESIYDLPDKCHIGIIDLDDKKFNNIEFISELKTKAKLVLIGYKSKIIKESHTAMKNAGCDILVPKASIVMNIQSLVKNLLN